MFVNLTSQGLALAGLAFAGGDAGAAMPSTLWRGATHFTLSCTVLGLDHRDVDALCARLRPLAAQSLALPFRSAADPNGVTVHLSVRVAGQRGRGTLFVTREAFRGETDDRSLTVPVDFDIAAPGPGLAAALQSLRTPRPIGPGLRRVRPMS